MPSADPEARLRHILENIDAIIGATQGRSPTEITNDYVVQRALERAVEIISEAAKALPAEFREREPDIPWSDIIGIGNLLRHEYYRIRSDRMLDILNDHLPRLRPAVLRLLSSISATDEPN
jgi:uncharacterized protein with HEPN domain